MLLVAVIWFLHDPVPVFRELHRFLVPPGRLVLGFIEREGEVARQYRHAGGYQRFLSRARFFASGEVQNLLGYTGCCVASVGSKAGFSGIAAEKN